MEIPFLRIAFYLIGLSLTPIFSQTLEFQLTPSAGFDNQSEGPQMDWSVGETVIGSPDTIYKYLHSGFRQVVLEEVLMVLNGPAVANSILVESIGGYLIIEIPGTASRFKINLFDSNGRVLAEYHSGGGEKLTLNWKEVSSWAAFMRIYSEEGSLVKSFKLFRGE